MSQLDLVRPRRTSVRCYGSVELVVRVVSLKGDVRELAPRTLHCERYGDRPHAADGRCTDRFHYASTPDGQAVWTDHDQVVIATREEQQR